MTTSSKQPAFDQGFSAFACIGDTITCEADGYTFTARIVADIDTRIDDDESHSEDRSVTGCTEEQHAELMAARAAWFRDEWCFVGIVISVSRNFIELDDFAASVWGIEMNYPGSDNAYLEELANDLLPEAMEVARSARTNALLALA